MNMTANVVTEMPMDVPVKAVAAKPMWETLYWSVRRELWENNSIFLGPTVIAGLVLFGILISVLRHPEVLAFVSAMDAEGQRNVLAVPFGVMATLVMMTSFLVAVFYCLDALYGERKDRSILFWKSLPVSDTTTVAAKVLVPMVVLPIVTFVVVLVAQMVMLLLGSLLMLAHHLNAAILWTRLPLLQMEVVFVYGLIVTSLWYAPIYGWLFLASSWAKRATLLWAILPWFAAGVLEAIAFHTNYVREMVHERFVGVFPAAFSADMQQRSGDARHIGSFLPLSAASPGHFLATPELWIGLVFAVAFFVVIVRVRRYREPI